MWMIIELLELTKEAVNSDQKSFKAKRNDSSQTYKI